MNLPKPSKRGFIAIMKTNKAAATTAKLAPAEVIPDSALLLSPLPAVATPELPAEAPTEANSAPELPALAAA